MRRLIAYITTTIAMLLAIGVAATPVLTKLNNGREFTNSRDYREIVFNIEQDENDKDNRAEVVAEVMRERLNNYNVEDYSIKVQGTDTVTVALEMNSKEFNYAAKYLCFSGESFALVTEKSVRNEHTLFKYDEIEIEYKGDANIPVIILPVTDEGKTDIKDLVKELVPEESKSIKKNYGEITRHEGHEDGEEGEEEKRNLLYLWANFDEESGESLESASQDPIAREKILMAFDAENIWYQDSKEAETEIYYTCATGQQDNPDQLDISGLKDDNARANYLVNMLKASKYKYEITCPTLNVDKNTMTVDYYTNASILRASAGTFLKIGNNVNIDVTSKLFISTAIAFIIVSLLLVVYYRLSSLAMIVTSAGTLTVTAVSFVSMHVLFNIPATIGFICLAAGVLFGEIVYVNRFKEEVYKGRSLKKANQEASKKSNLLTIDSAVVMAFTGLMMYAIGGTALKPLGVVLFFGAVFTLLMNLLVFKLLMYLVTNSTNLQSKYNVFNIDGEKVPNLMSAEEKPSYEAPFEKTDFTKKKSLATILFTALTAAAAAVIVVFGVTSSTKSPLNVEKAVADTTVIYTSIKVDTESPIVSDAESFTKYVLKDTKYTKEGENVELKKVHQFVYDSENPEEIETYYFILKLDQKLSDNDREKLEEDLNNNLLATFETSEGYVATVRNSKELIYTPSQGFVALATGISIIGVALYAAFRFRPSRGIALFVTATGATAISYGALVAMHFIGTTALTSVAMPLVAVTTMLASLFYFSTEKAMRAENHAITPEERKETMVKALGKSAAPMLVFMLINVYIAINFFGFGLDNTIMLFVSTLIGEAVAIGALLCFTGPFAEFVAKGLGKIRLPKFKMFAKDNKPKAVVRKNSSEPEETIFIGIND